MVPTEAAAKLHQRRSRRPSQARIAVDAQSRNPSRLRRLNATDTSWSIRQSTAPNLALRPRLDAGASSALPCFAGQPPVTLHKCYKFLGTRLPTAAHPAQAAKQSLLFVAKPVQRSRNNTLCTNAPLVSFLKCCLGAESSSLVACSTCLFPRSAGIPATIAFSYKLIVANIHPCGFLLRK